MFCTQCGVSAVGNSKYCSSCGSPMAGEESLNEQIVEIAIRQYPSVTATSPQMMPAYLPATQLGITDTFAGMSFSASIKSVFSKYARFQGRATRSEYWFFALFNFLVFVGIIFLAVLTSSSSSPDGTNIASILLFIWVLAIIIPSIAVTIRRLHDAGYSGWLYLLALIPYVGSAVMFIFSLLVSQQTDNQWGRAPKPFTSGSLLS